MTEMQQINEIATALSKAGWACSLMPWLGAEGLRWFATANDCGESETEVQTELHAEPLEAWRELERLVRVWLSGGTA